MINAMFTLAFVICTPDSECIKQYPSVYETKEDCVRNADFLMDGIKDYKRLAVRCELVEINATEE